MSLASRHQKFPLRFHVIQAQFIIFWRPVQCFLIQKNKIFDFAWIFWRDETMWDRFRFHALQEESTARNRDYFPEKRNPLLYKDLLPSQIVLDSHTKHAEQEQESYVISSDEEEYYRISSDEDEYFLISSDEEEEYQIISSKKMTPFDSIPPVLRSSALPHPQGESSSAKKKRRVPGTRSRQLEKRMRKLQKRIMVRCRKYHSLNRAEYGIGNINKQTVSCRPWLARISSLSPGCHPSAGVCVPRSCNRPRLLSWTRKTKQNYPEDPDHAD